MSHENAADSDDRVPDPARRRFRGAARTHTKARSGAKSGPSSRPSADSGIQAHASADPGSHKTAQADTGYRTYSYQPGNYSSGYNYGYGSNSRAPRAGSGFGNAGYKITDF